MILLKKKKNSSSIFVFTKRKKARNSIGRVAVLHTVCFRFESGRAYKKKRLEKLKVTSDY